jgi:6-phosphofructokinase 1
MRTLLIVSGGDAPGINAALYHFTCLSEQAGDYVVGAVGGVAGAVNGHLVDLHSEALAPVRGLGGTYLTSSREPVLRDAMNRLKLIQTISRQSIDQIVLLGGDGSLRHIPPILAEMGIACVGVPTTIDNDVPGTDETIGFDSACNAAHTVIDSLLATARALPGRIFSVETLGGSTGFLALDIARTAGAHAVLIPEYDYDESWLVDRLKWAVREYKLALLVLSEGVPASRTLVEDMQQRYNLRIRDTRLGHGQRGVAPTHRDRWLAQAMAEAAYTGLRDGLKSGTVAMQHGQITLCEGMVIGFPTRQPDRRLYEQINGLA